MIKKYDWVTCINSSSKRVGIVKRVAKDKSWADVEWGGWTKRMEVSILNIEHTIQTKDFEVTDYTRKRELENANKSR